MNKLSKNSWIVSTVLLLAGFLFLHFEIVDYGITFFMLFPLAVGFAIGTLEGNQKIKYSLIFGVLAFLGFLLAGELEGLVCVLMALPLFLVMMFVGHKIQTKTIDKEVNNTQKLMITISPIILLLAINPIEQILLPKPKVVTIENSIVLNYPPELVFDEVKQMDKLDAKKPIGLRLGLPSPYKCELEVDTIGAKRNCIFKNGTIIAEITKYEKGKILEMDVIDYTLTGRDWFEFIDATYTFTEVNDQTKITRTSSYKSVLHPRLYWQPLENWGIEQEHVFVLNSLKKNLKEKYGK